MPIREISIDWVGNEDETSEKIQSFSKIFVKNHKDNCADDSGSANDFSFAPDACTKEPWSFGHTFYCAGEDSPGWNSEFCTGADISNACCFKPKIYVKDNWGWESSSQFGGVIVVIP